MLRGQHTICLKVKMYVIIKQDQKSDDMILLIDSIQKKISLWSRSPSGSLVEDPPFSHLCLCVKWCFWTYISNSWKFNFDWCYGSGSNQEGDATAHSTSEVWKPYFKSSANYFQIGNGNSHTPHILSPFSHSNALQFVKLPRKIRNQCFRKLN